MQHGGEQEVAARMAQSRNDGTGDDGTGADGAGAERAPGGGTGS